MKQEKRVENVTLKGRIWHAEIMVNGKRERFSTKKTNKADAMRVARVRKREMLDDAAAAIEKGDSDTDFDDAASILWNAIKDKIRTKSETERVIKRAVELVGPRTMCGDIDTAFMWKVRSALLVAPPLVSKKGRPRTRLKGYMPKTVNKYTEITLRILTTAEKALNTTFPNKPAAEDVLLPVRGRSRYLKDTEEYLLAQKSDPDLLDLWKFDLETGLRANELIGLKWDETDSIEESLTVLVKSTGLHPRSHTVFLSDEALEILDRRRRLGQQEHVFTFPAQRTYRDADGFLIEAGTRIPAKYDNVQKRLAQAVKDAGLSNTILHDMRRTAARRIWWEAGLEVAAAFLGHTDVATTLAYLGLTESDTKAAIVHRSKRQRQRRAEVEMAASAGKNVVSLGDKFADKRIERILAELEWRQRVTGGIARPEEGASVSGAGGAPPVSSPSKRSRRKP